MNVITVNMERTMGAQKRKAGRNNFKETRHPIYKGVRQRKGKWVSEVRQPNDSKCRIWLGTFPHPDMAAIAHDVAALAFKGDSATLNFPQAACALPRLHPCSSAREIQFAAIEATERFSQQQQVNIASSMFPSSSSSPSFSSLCSTDFVCTESCKSTGDVVLDEEELFNMPVLIDSMAEGLIMTPPALEKGFSWADLETMVDLTLWED